MQDAEAVLGILRERGRKGLPCEELYRQMFNPQLYLLAWGRIYSNKGAMTPGITGGTPDGMSLARIGRVIDALRHERFRFRPDLDGQAGGRGDAPPPGGILRAPVLRPLPRFPAPARVPHRPARGGEYLDRDDLVHRGRHRPLLGSMVTLLLC